MSRATRLLPLVLAAALGSGCATVRWVDGATEGDLLGTAGTELGAVELLRGPPATRPDGEDGSASDAALEVFLEVMFEALAAW